MHPPKDPSCPFVVSLLLPLPAPGNHQSDFCLYNFAFSIVSYTWNYVVCSLFVFDSFHLASLLGDLLMQLHLLVVHSSAIMLSSIPVVWVCSWFMHLSVDEHQLSCFIFRLLWTKPLKIFTCMCEHMFCANVYFHFFGVKYLRVELLHHMLSAYLTFKEIAELFSKVAVPFCIPTGNVWELGLLHIFTWSLYLF